MISYEVKGGLFSAELLEDLATRQGQLPDDFGLASGIRVSDEASRAMSMARNQWANFQQAVERLHTEQTGVSETRNLWIIPLLSFLGYELQYVRSESVDGTTFQISHRDGNRDGFPVHIAGFRQSLDENPDSSRGNHSRARGRDSAHVQMQEYLNHTEHLYGIITNGYKLRLLRDHHRLTGIQYLEWDLEQLMTENDLASFTMLFRMLHVSRIPKRQGDDSLLEQYHQHSVEEGHRVRDKLKAAVYKSLQLLGNGFLQHPENTRLRDALEVKEVSAIAYGQHLRTLVYRLLFLFVAEDRQLVFRPDSEHEQQHLYRQYYSLNRLRNLAEAHLSANPRHSDAWEQVKATFRLFEEEDTGQPLGIAPLGGELFAPDALGALREAKINNRTLLKALDLLSRFEHEKGHRIRINYRRINVEEFGAVYESLLELNPEIDLAVRERPFQYIDGESRKGTGSFYTHQDLVKQLLKTALEPVVAERLAEAEKGITDLEERKRKKADALLKIKVCDPACGSGAFLVAAARALATELAYLRAPRGASIDHYEKPALREVIEHCIYGVDVNPDAAELCRLVLWMEAHEAGKPITYLDHKIRVGNSLVGWIGPLVLPEIPAGAFDPVLGDDKAAAKMWKARHLAPDELPMEWVDDPVEKLLVECDEFYAATQRPVATLDDYWRKKALHKEWSESAGVARQRLMYDLWTYAFFQQYSSDVQQPVVIKDVLKAHANGTLHSNSLLVQQVKAEAKAARFFHWPLEFPEVFQEGGFDLLLGNPPWSRIKLQEKKFFSGRKPEIANAPNAAERKKRIAALDPQDEHFQAFQAIKLYASRLSRYVRKCDQYELTRGGDINTYSIFAERAMKLIACTGQLGVIVPTGIATGHTNRHFFAHLAESKRLVSLFDFENRDSLFPAIGSQEKFCLLTIRGSSRTTHLDCVCAFSLHQVSELAQQPRIFELSFQDFLQINPNSQTCPVFRTHSDAKIVRKAYGLFPVINNEKNSSNPWAIKFRRVYDMSSDSGLFRHRRELRQSGAQLVGFRLASRPLKNEWLRLYEAKMFESYNHRFATFDRARVREESTRMLSVQELQVPDTIAEPWYWLKSGRIGDRLPDNGWEICCRKIARANDGRTLISTILPTSVVGDSAILIQSGLATIMRCTLAGMFASLMLDFLCRQKHGGMNVSFFTLEQLPIIPPDHFTPTDLQFLVPRVLELTYTAWDLQAFANDVWRDADKELKALIAARWRWNKDFVSLPEDVEARFAWPTGCEPKPGDFPHSPFRWDTAHRHRVQCELDAFFFHKYGFTPAETDEQKRKENEEAVKYILDPELSELAGNTEEERKAFPGETFRVLKDKETRKHGEFLTARLVLEAWHAQPWERPHELPDTVQQSTQGKRRTNFTKARLMPPVMARILQRNENPRFARLLGRTKMEKLLHLIEADTGLDFGRAPQKHHYGPADLDALDEAIKVGQEQAAFREVPRHAEHKGENASERKSRQYQKLEHFDTMLHHFTEHYADQQAHIDRIIDLFAPLDNNETELRVTLYAEWNNRLIKGESTDTATLCAAANKWSDAKERKFTQADFEEALQWLRDNDLVPKGVGKVVEEIAH